MKRAFWLGLMLAVLLAGCQKQPAEAADAAPAPTEAVTALPATALPPSPTPQTVLLTPAPTAPATPTATPLSTPSPVPTPSPAPVPTPFALVWVPDTQHFAYYHPESFITLADWITEHRESENILGVIHPGDLVDNGFKQWQWDNFYPFLEHLDPTLFFFSVAGNHDIGTKAQSFSAYLKQPFLDAYPDEQKYQGGKMLYQVLSAGDSNILLLGVGWELWNDRTALKWIDQVLADHAGMPCILVVHGFLLYETRYYDAVERMVAKRPAIKLVICGHMDGYYTRVFDYDDDQDGTAERHVTAMMLNMQRAQDYAFRLLVFDPVTHSVNVRTLKLDGSPAPDLEGRGPISFCIENAY